MEKSITMQQTTEMRRFVMCYCGELFDNGNDWANHFEILLNACAPDDYRQRFLVNEKHNGYWIPYYKIVTLKEKEMAQSQRK